MRRAVAIVIVGLALAACGGGGPSDGYQLVGTGDTYGEWDLFAEVQDGRWTGCLRWDGGADAVTKQCFEPESLDELLQTEAEDVRFGAFPEGRTLVFSDGGKAATFDDLDVPDWDFFVVAAEAEVELAD